MIPLHSWVPAIGQWLARSFAPVMNMILTGDFSQPFHFQNENSVHQSRIKTIKKKIVQDWKYKNNLKKIYSQLIIGERDKNTQSLNKISKMSGVSMWPALTVHKEKKLPLFSVEGKFYTWNKWKTHWEKGCQGGEKF